MPRLSCLLAPVRRLILLDHKVGVLGDAELLRILPRSGTGSRKIRKRDGIEKIPRAVRTDHTRRPEKHPPSSVNNVCLLGETAWSDFDADPIERRISMSLAVTSITFGRGGSIHQGEIISPPPPLRPHILSITV